ncbi:hypothetical protein GCM10022206_17990 [Streptomyces chiangmaiensis]
MARPESPIPETAPPPLRHFAQRMRSSRKATGINYRDMAKVANYSASALSQGASGKELPTWELTRAYILACDEDENEWQAFWEETQKLLSEPSAPSREEPADHNQVIESERGLSGAPRLATVKVPTIPKSTPIASFRADWDGPEYIVTALQLLRARAGQPSLRQLEARFRRNGQWISKTTLSRALGDERRLPSLELTLGLAQACDAAKDEQLLLRQAWHRIRSQKNAVGVPPPEEDTSPAAPAETGGPTLPQQPTTSPRRSTDRLAELDGTEEPAAELVALLNLLRRYMGELGWSYMVLSKRTGVTASTWNRWYTHKKLPTRDALISFANAAPTVVDREELLGLWHAAWQAQETKQARAAGPVPAGAEQEDRQAAGTPATTRSPEQLASTETTPQTEVKKQAGWVVAVIMSVVVLAGGGALWGINTSAYNPANTQGTSPLASPTTSPATAPPLTTCHRDSCTSVEPKESICSLDAITAYIGRKFGATIELRYSPRCAAAWAKMSNTSPGDGVTITSKNGDSEEYRQQYGHNAYTRMIPVTRLDDARACAKIQNRGTVCVAAPELSSPTPT